MDFYGYWHEKREAEKYPYAVSTISFNTTFYFQDNAPGSGHLRFVKDGHLIEPEHLYPLDRPKFEAWCEAQKHVILHPMAGDCVVFMNHIPHQGAKEHDDMERSNVVCHYQVTPMHEVVSICLSTTGVRWNFPIYQLTLSSKEVRATRYYDIILTGNCGITGLKEIFGVADFYGQAYVSLALPTSSEIGRSDWNNFYHEFFRLGTIDESGDWKYDEKTKIGFIEFMRRWQFNRVGTPCVETHHRCYLFPVDFVWGHHQEFAETYSYFLVKEGLVEGVLPAEAYIRRVNEEYMKRREEGTQSFWEKDHRWSINNINIHLKRINIELTLTKDPAGNDKYGRIEKEADLLTLAYD